jgi:hypothetical protein
VFQLRPKTLPRIPVISSLLLKFIEIVYKYKNSRRIIGLSEVGCTVGLLMPVEAAKEENLVIWINFVITR